MQIITKPIKTCLYSQQVAKTYAEIITKIHHFFKECFRNSSSLRDDPFNGPSHSSPYFVFLSAPAHISETLVDQVAVANSDNDYAERDLAVIERLANLYEITMQRQRAEQELKTHRDRLEEMVKERTAELTVANDRLQQEILERERVERKLRSYAETQKVLVSQVNHRVKNNLNDHF